MNCNSLSNEEKKVSNGERVIKVIQEAIKCEAQVSQGTNWVLNWDGDWTDYSPWAGQNG